MSCNLGGWRGRKESGAPAYLLLEGGGRELRQGHATGAEIWEIWGFARMRRCEKLEVLLVPSKLGEGEAGAIIMVQGFLW